MQIGARHRNNDGLFRILLVKLKHRAVAFAGMQRYQQVKGTP